MRVFSSSQILIVLVIYVLAGAVSLIHSNNRYNISMKGNNTEMLYYAPIGAKKCMQELGCFVIDEEFFHIIYRPLNLLPNDRLFINTKFYLYTRKNPKEHWILHANDTESIQKSPLNKEHPTRFIIHGFLDSKWYGKWMEVLKDNLLLHSENNVIIVDWSGGNSLPYSQAAANTRVVGAEVALLINRLKGLKDVSLEECHVIGHSLGAHAAGYAGERIKNIGRISGIDPAEPFFQYMPPAVRLDPTDAEFVDVIHTDSVSILFFGLGMSQAIGHIDFYPNDGKNQPGCKTEAIKSLFLEGLIEATRRFTACSHQRAVDFFIYSVNYRKATPVGYHCSSWQNYTNGFCTNCGEDGSGCAIMGIRADEFKRHISYSQSRKFYLRTSGAPPYWVSQYKIQVKLSGSVFSKQKNHEGKMQFIIHGQFENLTTHWLQRKFVHGELYSLIGYTDKYLGTIHAVTLSWRSSSWNFLKTKNLSIHFVRIISLNMISETEKKEFMKVFCGNPELSLKSGEQLMLRTGQCESEKKSQAKPNRSSFNSSLVPEK